MSLREKTGSNTYVFSLVIPAIKSVVHNSTSTAKNHPNVLWRCFVPLKLKTELSGGLSAHSELPMQLHSTSLENSTGHALNQTASIRMSYSGRKGIKISFSIGQLTTANLNSIQVIPSNFCITLIWFVQKLIPSAWAQYRANSCVICLQTLHQLGSLSSSF